MPPALFRRGIAVTALVAAVVATVVGGYFYRFVLVRWGAASSSSDNSLAPLGAFGADRLINRTGTASFRAPAGAFLPVETLLSEHPQTRLTWDSTSRIPLAWVNLEGRHAQVRRRALVSPPGGVFEFPVLVPPEGWLEIWCGSLSVMTRVQHVVERVDERGVAERVFSTTNVDNPHRVSWWERRVWPASLRHRKHHEEQWRLARVNLSAWAGRTVRLRFRVESLGDDPSASLAFWGEPTVWGVREGPAEGTRGGRSPAVGASVVLVVLEKARGDGISLEGFSDQIPPSLQRFYLEGVGVRRFYTNATPASHAWSVLWTSGFPRPGSSSGDSRSTSWPALLRAQGYRTVAIGAFDDSDLRGLPGEPFDEIHTLPNDGYGAPAAAREAREWIRRERGRSPFFLTVYLRGVPPSRWPPLRFWPLSPRRFLDSLQRWSSWRASAEQLYVDDEMGRFVSDLSQESLRDAVVSVVSLTGSGGGDRPVRRRSTGRRGWRFEPDGGNGLRENDIRGVWCVRHRSLPAGRLLAQPGQLVDVGPSLLSLVGVGVPPITDGRALDFRRESPLEDTTVRVSVRGRAAKALLVDGHFKYIRHGKPVLNRRRGWMEDYAREEVFDLWADPGEQKNLASERRTLLARLRQSMTDTDPDPTDIRLSFRGMANTPVQGAVTCSVNGLRLSPETTVPVVLRGTYEFAFTLNGTSGDVVFETDPPGASYMMSVLLNGRYIPASQWRVSRLGLPLFESSGETWHDRIKFAWMEGWPVVSSTVPTVCLGRRERDPQEWTPTLLPFRPASGTVPPLFRESLSTGASSRPAAVPRGGAPSDSAPAVSVDLSTSVSRTLSTGTVTPP